MNAVIIVGSRDFLE